MHNSVEETTDLEEAEPAFVRPAIRSHPRCDLIHSWVSDSAHVVVRRTTEPPRSLEYCRVCGDGDAGRAFDVSDRVIAVVDHLTQDTELLSKLKCASRPDISN